MKKRPNEEAIRSLAERMFLTEWKDAGHTRTFEHAIGKCIDAAEKFDQIFRERMEANEPK